MNHEIRFDANKELKEDLDKLHKLYPGISKAAFVRAIFISGIEEFKSKLSSGYFPTFVSQQNQLKLEMKKNK